MTTEATIATAAVSLTALGMIGGVVYGAVRMGIRDAVLALELRIGDKYVTAIACDNYRVACATLRAAEDKTG